MLRKRYLISVIIIILILFSYNNPTDHIIRNIKPKNTKPYELPIGRVIIPTLNIDKNIYNLNSRNNNVEKNITLLEGSVLPDNDNSIIFLAAHSGTSHVSFFSTLDKLNYDDIVIFIYKNYQYNYKVNSIYEQLKDGDIEVKKESTNQLVLTTCNPNKNNSQLIISCNLYKKWRLN